MTPPKEIKKAPITDSKEIEIYELSDNEIGPIFLRKFSELQEHMDRQLNKSRKTMHERKEVEEKKSKTKKKTPQKTQNRILELKNTMTKLENATESFNSMFKQPGHQTG